MKISVLITLGSLLLAIALIGGSMVTILSARPLFKNPADEAEYTIETPENVSMVKGDYEVWIIENEVDWDVLSINVTRAGNSSILIEKTDGKLQLKSEKVSYIMYGRLTISKDGVYNISSSETLTVYIVSPLEVQETWTTLFISACLTYLIVIIGGILFIVGVVKHVKAKRSDRYKKENVKKGEQPSKKQGWKWVFLSYKGRLKRKSYIIGTLLLGFLILAVWGGGIIIWVNYPNIVVLLISIPILLLISFALIWPESAMAAKRLRDMGEEPLFAILYIVFPQVPGLGGLGKLGMWIWMIAEKGDDVPDQHRKAELPEEYGNCPKCGFNRIKFIDGVKYKCARCGEIY